MAKDPAVLWYYTDYLNGTEHMSFEEQGAYTRLLCKQADLGHMSIAFIKRVLGKAFKKIWPSIENKFSVDEDGNFFQHRMDEEKEKRKKHIAHQTENGKKGGRPKENPRVNPNETQTITQTEPKEKPLENENENEIKDRGTGKGFELSAKIPLPELTQEAAEMNQFTMTQNRNTVFVQQQWKIFLKERMNELPQKKYYSIGDLTSYFLNWIRTKHPKKNRFEEQESKGPDLKILN